MVVLLIGLQVLLMVILKIASSPTTLLNVVVVQYTGVVTMVISSTLPLPITLLPVRSYLPLVVYLVVEMVVQYYG